MYRTPRPNRRPALMLALLIAPAIASAQASSYTRVLEQWHRQRQHFNGVALVAEGGKVQCLQAWGTANWQNGTLLDVNHRFRIASVTKTFTAVLVMQLVEQGRLGLDSPIGHYLPGYPGPGKDRITIRHLLTYSSGLPNCESYRGDSIYAEPMPVDSFITRYCSGTPEVAPGTRFGYNNGDYILLGRILEEVSGKPFEALLRSRILRPLRMTRTDLLTGGNFYGDAGLVHTYTYDTATKSLIHDKQFAIGNYFSAGAMYSTAADLLKFDQAIFNHRLLKKETVDLMLTPNPALDNAGLGFWVSEGFGAMESRFAYRPGGIYGATANWIHVIAPNRTIIVLSNTDATDLFGLSQALNAVTTGQ